MEKASGGSILKILQRFGPMVERLTSVYARNALEGLVYLHQNKIVHRNLKASNLLIHNDGTVKISDFANCGLLGDEDDVYENALIDSLINSQTAFWLPPEIVLRKKSGTPKSDIWSLGCVVLEMLTGAMPWRGQVNNLLELKELMKKGVKPTYPTNISFNCIQFLNALLNYDPDLRPDAESLIGHPFLNDSFVVTTFSTEHDMGRSKVNIGALSQLLDEYKKNASNNNSNYMSHSMIGVHNVNLIMSEGGTDDHNQTTNASLNTFNRSTTLDARPSKPRKPLDIIDEEKEKEKEKEKEYTTPTLSQVDGNAASRDKENKADPLIAMARRRSVKTQEEEEERQRKYREEMRMKFAMELQMELEKSVHHDERPEQGLEFTMDKIRW
eukprot:TRINITY_DN1415_c0_g1_i8.p1 TRINITY_DN1415_c0_g1~~TRINITY_DN1415_c0_g1_i8.p1  ORF type:complete len:384 (+),score=54.56 TRINITY_DN1415_c0_g1_i8:701-1852(+)